MRTAIAQCVIVSMLVLATPWLGAAQNADAPSLPTVELPGEIERVLRDYERAWTGGDAIALADLFTEEGMVRDDRGWLRGREAISKKYENAGGALRLRAVQYAAGDTSGFVVGTYGYGTEEAFDDRGVFILALRRDAPGEPWRIAADLDNSINR